MKIKKVQTAKEERWNVITHAFGFILALFATFFLLYRGFEDGSQVRLISYLIYSVGLITLYLASTLYHSAQDPVRKKRLNIFDHSAIYLLIAGTYTPIALLNMKGVWGIAILTIVWCIALVGIVMKLYFTGRYSKISTAT